MIKEFIIIRRIRKDNTYANVMLCKSYTEAFNIVDRCNKDFNTNYCVGIVMFQNGKRI